MRTACLDFRSLVFHQALKKGKPQRVISADHEACLVQSWLSGELILREMTQIFCKIRAI